MLSNVKNSSKPAEEKIRETLVMKFGWLQNQPYAISNFQTPSKSYWMNSLLLLFTVQSKILTFGRFLTYTYVSTVVMHAFCQVEWAKEYPGMETLKGFFQVGNQKEYQNMVVISFVHLKEINIFCFMHKSVVQKLSLPHPLEN